MVTSDSVGSRVGLFLDTVDSPHKLLTEENVFMEMGHFSLESGMLEARGSLDERV